MHAEEDRERPARHVVGRLALGVALHLEEVFYVRAIRLLSQDHDRTRRPAATVRRDLSLGHVHLNTATDEGVGEALHSEGVTVCRGQDPGERGLLRALFERALGGLEGV